MELRIASDGDERDIAQIHGALKAYNISKTPELVDDVPLGVYLENDAGEKLAGLTGETFGNWLCIKYLWVSESERGKGTGTRIMRAAEDEARRRGCKHVFVDTFSFQAPKFYRKLGYKDAFALTEYPYTGARYYFTKEL